MDAAPLRDSMLDLAHRSLSEDKARTLLRKLRDLNLTSDPIALDARARVSLRGCVSSDEPAESGVRYRMRFDDGADGILEIRADSGVLEVALRAARADRRITLPVSCDRLGRACVRQVGARVAPETSEARELEHFLRRIVRALFATT